MKIPSRPLRIVGDVEHFRNLNQRNNSQGWNILWDRSRNRYYYHMRHDMIYIPMTYIVHYKPITCIPHGGGWDNRPPEASLKRSSQSDWINEQNIVAKEEMESSQGIPLRETNSNSS